MLSAMRVTAKSFVMKALMIVLVISFAVWGVGDIVRSGNSSYLVKVGGETVTYPEYARRVTMLERMMQSMGMKNLERSAIQDQVMRQMVEEKLVILRLKEIGLAPNDELLKARLVETPMFHDVRGKFDPKMFRATLVQRNMSEAMFLADMKADIRASAFTSSLGTDGMTPPPALTALQSVSTNERRDAALVTIPASSVKLEALTDEALTAYYDKNKELLYMQPEQRTLEYVTFPASELERLADKDITEEELNDRFESEKESLGDKATRASADKQLRSEARSEHMETIVDEVTMKIEDALAAGDSMGAAMANAGLSAQSKLLSNATAEQYAQSKDTLVRSVAERGFALEEGETSNLEVSDDGHYYMVAVKELKAAEPKPFAAVKADVQKRANALARTKQVRAKAAEVKTALEEKDWNAALAKLGLKARTVIGIRRPELGTTPGMPDLLAQAVFEHEVGGIAGPMTQDNGDAALAKITAITHAKPSDAKPDTKASEAASKQISEEIMQSYYRTLTKRYPVQVNEAMLQQIRSGESE